MFIQEPATGPHSKSDPTQIQFLLVSILILSLHLRLHLLGCFFASCFPTKSLYAFAICPMSDKCPNSLILLNFITLIAGEELFIMFFFPPFCNLRFIPLSSAFPNVLNTGSYSSHRVKYQVSYSYKTTGKMSKYKNVKLDSPDLSNLWTDIQYFVSTVTSILNKCPYHNIRVLILTIVTLFNSATNS